MKTPRSGYHGPIVARSRDRRLFALDAFRGLDVLLMIFVNHLGGMKGVPWWLEHAERRADLYTLTDLVFPGFLFIMGAALPLAFMHRRAEGDSLARIFAHVALRVAGLLILGVMFVNEDDFSAVNTGMSKDAWYALALLAAIGTWNAWPRSGSRPRRAFFLGARLASAALLAWLLWRFKGAGAGGVPVPLQHQWWGILGIIGWCYLAGTVAWFATRGSTTGLVGLTGFLLAVHLGVRQDVVSFPFPLSEIEWSMAAIVVAGAAVGSLFAARPEPTAGARVRFMGWFGLGLITAGYLMRPWHGIHKDDGTESYALVSAGWACLALLAVYHVTDMHGWKQWAAPAVTVGRNALLAYLLPDLLGALAGLAHVDLMPFW